MPLYLLVRLSCVVASFLVTYKLVYWHENTNTSPFFFLQLRNKVKNISKNISIFIFLSLVYMVLVLILTLYYI